MARNPVQFQNGISLSVFLSLCGTEGQCFDALYRWRWPNGFLCPHCGHDRCYQLNTRKLQQCNRCHRQTSITAGTIFDSTKLPLTVSATNLSKGGESESAPLGRDSVLAVNQLPGRS